MIKISIHGENFLDCKLSNDSISLCCSKDPENADSRLESLVMGASFTSGSVIEVEYIA